MDAHESLLITSIRKVVSRTGRSKNPEVESCGLTNEQLNMQQLKTSTCPTLFGAIGARSGNYSAIVAGGVRNGSQIGSD